MFKPSTMGRIPQDLTGQKFGSWTVVEFAGHKNKIKVIKWLCRCDCGHTSEVDSHSLTSGGSSKCRCCARKGRDMKRTLRPYEALYKRLCRTGKRRDQSTSLTFEEFLEFTKIDRCSYCLKPIQWSVHVTDGKNGAYNLDRLDNSQGYSKDNCIPCCKNCNRIRGNILTHEQMKEVGLLIQKWEKLVG